MYQIIRICELFGFGRRSSAGNAAEFATHVRSANYAEIGARQSIRFPLGTLDLGLAEASPSPTEEDEARMPLQDHNLEAYHSSLAGDPDLQDLLEDFVDQIPDRIAALSETLADGDWDQLGRLAHQFKSAVGSYGFEAVTPLAGDLETTVREGFAEDYVQRALDDLSIACRRIRSDPT